MTEEVPTAKSVRKPSSAETSQNPNGAGGGPRRNSDPEMTPFRHRRHQYEGPFGQISAERKAGDDENYGSSPSQRSRFKNLTTHTTSCSEDQID